MKTVMLLLLWGINVLNAVLVLYTVHRIVAELFLSNPENYSDVDHLDNNRMNPDVKNLEWVPHEENIKRAYERGGHIGRAIGEKNPKARLKPEVVLKLRDEYKAGITIQEMSDKYGLPWNTVGNKMSILLQSLQLHTMAS